MVTKAGDWYLRDGNLILTSSELGPRVEDKSPILHVEKRKIVLQEEDGSITVLYKIN